MKKPNDLKKLISNVFLAVLVAVSVFLAGAVAAKYLTDSSGNSMTQVAKWQVNATVTPPADSGKVVAADGTSRTGNYVVVFTNNSEVNAYGTIEVSGVPSGMSPYFSETPDGTGTPVVPLSGWSVPMNGGTKTIYIYFKANFITSDKYDSITITPVITQSN